MSHPLLGLWRSKFFELAAFYGGTALRILHGLDRSSEDLDFSLLASDGDFALARFTGALEAELRAFGFEVRIAEKEKRHASAITSAFLEADTLQQLLEIRTPAGVVRTRPRGQVLKMVLCRRWKGRVKGRDWYDLVWFAGRHPALHLSHLEARMVQSGDWPAKDRLTPEAFGALNLESDDLGAYSDADVNELGYFATVAAISIEKAVLHHQVLEKQQLQHHLELARDVQVNLLPASAPVLPGYDLAGVNEATMEIGGDYFDYLPLDDGRLALVVADVSGKGMAAALIMATFRAALRAEYRRACTVEDVMHAVHGLVLDSIDHSRYVTALYNVLEPRSGEFTYVNCGQTPPMLIRADGRCTLLDKGRPALGMPVCVAGESGRVVLEPGDMLVIYTDGVVELLDPAGEEFGRHRLESLLRDRAGLSAAQVVNDVKRATLDFQGLPAYEDDFTLMVVKRVRP